MIDVLIAGAGPAGLTAALSAAERGLKVCVVDPRAGHGTKRGELLAQGAADLMARLGLESALAEAVVIKDIISDWGPQAQGGHPTLGLHGWGVDRQRLARRMIQVLEQRGVPLIPADISAPQRDGAAWRVKTDQGQTLYARYLIDATGRPARLARALGAKVQHGPDLVALTWRVDGDMTSMRTKAVPNGWWYQVPCPGGATVGFVTSGVYAKSLRSRGLDVAGQAQGFENSALLAASNADVWDSRMSQLDRMSGSGWLAAGDAAVAFDPVASQGLFNALSAGFFAGQAAADALAGDHEAPLVYEALMQRTASRTLSATHLQYAAAPFDAPFWRARAVGRSERALA